MKSLSKILEPLVSMPEPERRQTRLPNHEYLLKSAEIASQLPELNDIPEGNLIYRGTLLHRLVFNIRDELIQIIDNIPTENQFIINATRSRLDAAHYAKSYDDELAPVSKRIDPVVMIFDPKELKKYMSEHQKRWFIPKEVMRKCQVGLAFPGRDFRANTNPDEWGTE